MDNRIKSLFGITEDDYRKLRFNLNESSVHTALGSDDLHVLYFDSDDGCALFSTPCEMFEESGIKLELIDCKYCDISLSDLNFIYRGFESYSRAVANEN
tara:strand:+ start:1091 stop:1387 length:297 start_codon:yes stop_codon:yes gene_type:complete